MSLETALMQAIQYADEQGIILSIDLRNHARWAGAIKAGDTVIAINKKYHDAITQALIKYFEGGPIADSRNAFKQSSLDALGAAFDLGWTKGGQELPLDEDTLSWFESRLQEEFSNINSLFVDAKQLRRDQEFDYFSWITNRADGYTNTVTAFYNAGLLLAKKNEMLTWQLGNTETHCKTCSKLDGQKHRASWYVAHNYIPRKPGAAMLCGGYNCDCTLLGMDGQTVTL